MLSLAACSKAPEADRADEAPDWQTQYDLGVRYLSEGIMKKAILAFEAAIEIDPRNADAYLKLAQVCEQREDYAKSAPDAGGWSGTDGRPAPAEYIWQVKVSLLEKPGAIEGTALNGTAEEVVYDPSLDDPYCEVVPEGYTRSVLLALDDVTWRVPVRAVRVHAAPLLRAAGWADRGHRVSNGAGTGLLQLRGADAVLQ
ncbi:MAG: tetratricopeptide repeat protein [Oscillospiraceae bacterium]